MARKRFTDTEKWLQDWFIDLPNELKLTLLYIWDHCDHAGIWKPSRRHLEFILGSSPDLDELLKVLNEEKERVRVIESDRWLFLDFYSFQYGSTLNINNKVHKSIYAIYQENGIDLKIIRGLNEVKLTPNRGQDDLREGVKEKDIDKEKDMDVEEEESEKEGAALNIPFEKFWDLYDKKVGPKDKIKKKWEELKDSEREECIRHIPQYINSKVEKLFRKDPMTYLNQNGWEDEIIVSEPQYRPNYHKKLLVSANAKPPEPSKNLDDYDPYARFKQPQP